MNEPMILVAGVNLDGLGPHGIPPFVERGYFDLDGVNTRRFTRGDVRV